MTVCSPALVAHTSPRVNSAPARLDRDHLPATNNWAARMVDGGLAREFMGPARNRRFTYQSYSDLVHDAESDTGA